MLLRPMRRRERIARQRRRRTQWYITRQVTRMRAVVTTLMSTRMVMGRDVQVAAATVVVAVEIDVVVPVPHPATVDVMVARP